MADRIRRVTTVGQNVVKGFKASDGLILAESAQEIGEFMFGDIELAHGLGKSHKNRMSRVAVVTGVELTLPLIQQCERGGGITDFVAEVVGDAAVGVDVEEMLAQPARKKPAGDGEILVVRAGQPGAVFASLG